MDALLRSLENESLLLMYLAGELPAEDQREVDALVATDGGLRAQLEEIRASEEAMLATLSQLDAAEPLGSAESAVRSVSREIRQWHIDRLARPATLPAARPRIPVWAYPIATAAVVLIGFCFSWGLRADHGNAMSSNLPDTSQADTSQAGAGDQVAVDNAQGDPAASSGDRPQDRVNGSATIVTLDASSQGLADLERVVSDDLQ